MNWGLYRVPQDWITIMTRTSAVTGNFYLPSVNTIDSDSLNYPPVRWFFWGVFISQMIHTGANGCGRLNRLLNMSKDVCGMPVFSCELFQRDSFGVGEMYVLDTPLFLMSIYPTQKSDDSDEFIRRPPLTCCSKVRTYWCKRTTENKGSGNNWSTMDWKFRLEGKSGIGRIFHAVHTFKENFFMLVNRVYSSSSPEICTDTFITPRNNPSFPGTET